MKKVYKILVEYTDFEKDVVRKQDLNDVYYSSTSKGNKALNKELKKFKKMRKRDTDIIVEEFDSGKFRIFDIGERKQVVYALTPCDINLK